jgi:hypothetical protein
MYFFLVLVLAFFDILLYNYTIACGMVENVVIGRKEKGGYNYPLYIL